MKVGRYILLLWAAVLGVSTTAAAREFTPGKSYLAPGREPALTTYALDASASGFRHDANTFGGRGRIFAEWCMADR